MRLSFNFKKIKNTHKNFPEKFHSSIDILNKSLYNMFSNRKKEVEKYEI